MYILLKEKRQGRHNTCLDFILKKNQTYVIYGNDFYSSYFFSIVSLSSVPSTIL